MAGYKSIWIVLLVVVVALAGVSPVFAPYLIFTPAAACPGERVIISNLPEISPDFVGGGISVAAGSPSGIVTINYLISSDPVGLITEQKCSVVRGTNGLVIQCSFVVSESARCGHYTVTYTEENNFGLSVSGPFDVPSSCCAVGGCVQPVNTFALLSPWLLAIGLVGCIGTVVVVAKKRHP